MPHTNTTIHQTGCNSRQSNARVHIGTIPLARDTDAAFAMDAADFNEHFYIIGRSGSGKSNLLKQLAIADMQRGAGFCFIDPIGTAAEELLTHVPTDCRCNDAIRFSVCCSDAPVATGHDKTCQCSSSQHQCSRDKDIIYIDASDTDYPIGINPLYDVKPEDRARVVSDILQMFESIWHDSGWGPRMESIFRAALHTLIENPHCMRPSLLTVFRLLLDSEFWHRIKQDITNPQVLDWWNYRFDRGDLNERTRREWVEPVLNKIDALSLDPVIRNIIGQPRCTLNFEEIIKRKQILIVNLAQHKIGHDNASFLGMLIIARMRQAASKVGDRDNPFYLTVDEAHSFPTMELAHIVTQGRHIGLFCSIAHQHLAQFDETMPELASVLRNGCGSLAVFAVGNKDAETIIDDLEPMHRDRTLNMIRSLGNGEVVLRLTENGAPQPPPNYPVLVHKPESGNAKIQSAINFTRQRFGTERLKAEFQIVSANDRLNREELLAWMSRFKQHKQ